MMTKINCIALVFGLMSYSLVAMYGKRTLIQKESKQKRREQKKLEEKRLNHEKCMDRESYLQRYGTERELMSYCRLKKVM